MKRKFLSVLAVFLVCCTAMFMFAGCNSPADQNKFGTLTSSATAALPLTQGQTKDEALTSVTFTFALPTDGTKLYQQKWNSDTNRYEKVEITQGWGPLSYAEALAKGMVVSGFDTSSPTEEGKTRKMTCKYLQVKCTIEYTVAAA